MEFTKLTINDQKQYNILLKKNLDIFGTSEGSELCFANLFAWKDDDNITIYHGIDYLLIKGLYRGNIYFLPPLVASKEAFDQAMIDLRQYCQVNKIFMIIYETSDAVKEFMKKYHEDYDLISYWNRDLAEYIYDANDLRTLSGKKYHAKRNFITRFQNKYQFTFTKYIKDDYEELLTNLKNWDIKRYDDNEIQAITNVLDNIESLKAFCNVLRIENKIVGFTIWALSNANKDIAYVMFEKGNPSYEGIFPMINYLCCNENFKDILYLNRQEDMGIANLRKSKLSYHPHHLAMKSTLVSKKLIIELRDLYQKNFCEDDKYTDYFFQNINYHQIEYLDENHEIISSLFIIPKELHFFDTTITCPLIVGLSTRSQYRNMGKCRLLLQKTLNNLYKQNISIVYLYPYPVDHEFYRHFGFGLMNYLNTEESNIIRNGEIADISNFYERIVSDKNIYLIRNSDDYLKLNEKIKAYDGKIKISNNGYQILSADGLEEALYDTIPTQKGMMTRILDIKVILSNYRFADEDNNKQFKIKIIDNEINKNNILIKLTITNNYCTIEDCDNYTDIIDIITITEAIFLGNKESNIPFLKLFKKQNVINNDKY